MALATSLTKEEMEKTLKGAMKRQKRRIVPPPKYLCTPSSLQIQKKVTTLDKEHCLIKELCTLVASHGDIAELRHLSVPSMKRIFADQHVAEDGTKEIPKLPAIRRFVVRHLKNKFLENSTHRPFWSNIHIGVNDVLRRLERIGRGSTRELTDQSQPRVCCVLLDVGWLKSQLGHHIAHLCAIHGVRLIVVRPIQALANLFSTDLYTVTKCIAVGITEPDATNISASSPELCDWIGRVRAGVPPLTLPSASIPSGTKSTTQAIKRPAAENEPSGTDPTAATVQPWECYKIDRDRLYLPAEATAPPDRVITLNQLWSRLGPPRVTRSPPTNATNVESSHAADQPEFEFLPLIQSPKTPRFPYDKAIVRTVPAQSEADRREKKAQKRRHSDTGGRPGKWKAKRDKKQRQNKQ